MSEGRRSDLAWAILLARLLLALLFLMSGWHKVFEMGAVEHARRLFVEGYADSWIPAGLLWALGTAIPFLELAAGLLLAVGLWVRPALVALGGLLVVVTYGHLLAEPFYDVTTHVFPRALLVIGLLAAPAELDRWSLDRWLAGRGGGRAKERP